jgi:ABC-type glycerol-3-phosphate transport system permease component
MTLPLSIWMMCAYFRQLPKSLEEAASVDGLSRWQALGVVATPLAAPGVAVAVVFIFIAVWAEFFFALILTSRYAFTLPMIFRAAGTADRAMVRLDGEGLSLPLPRERYSMTRDCFDLVLGLDRST